MSAEGFVKMMKLKVRVVQKEEIAQPLRKEPLVPSEIVSPIKQCYLFLPEKVKQGNLSLLLLLSSLLSLTP